MEQRRITFSENTRQQIVHYHESARTESRTDGAQVKLTPTQKQALASICRDNNIGVSTFIADALDAYIEMFPYREKIKRHRATILSLLDSMS